MERETGLPQSQLLRGSARDTLGEIWRTGRLEIGTGIIMSSPAVSVAPNAALARPYVSTTPSLTSY